LGHTFSRGKKYIVIHSFSGPSGPYSISVGKYLSGQLTDGLAYIVDEYLPAKLEAMENLRPVRVARETLGHCLPFRLWRASLRPIHPSWRMSLAGKSPVTLSIPLFETG